MFQVLLNLVNDNDSYLHHDNQYQSKISITDSTNDYHYHPTHLQVNTNDYHFAHAFDLAFDNTNDNDSH